MSEKRTGIVLQAKDNLAQGFIFSFALAGGEIEL